MEKEETIAVEGTVVEPLPNAMFKVELREWAYGSRPYFREDADAFY